GGARGRGVGGRGVGGCAGGDSGGSSHGLLRVNRGKRKPEWRFAVISIGYSTIEISGPNRKPCPEHCQGGQLPNSWVGDHRGDFLCADRERLALAGCRRARYGAQDRRGLFSRAD